MQNNPINSFNPIAVQRKAYENKYTSARVNLLLVVVFTAINAIMLATGNFTYFLFSASIPYFVVDMGMIMCGKYPPETYVDGLDSMIIFEPSTITIFVVIALLLVSIYLVFWFFSKKKVGFLMAALVCFIIDTLGMFVIYGISFDSIIDILFHGYVIWTLISGIKAHNALLNLPKEDIAYAGGEGGFTVEPEAPSNVAEAKVAETDTASEDTPGDEG